MSTRLRTYTQPLPQYTAGAYGSSTHARAPATTPQGQKAPVISSNRDVPEMWTGNNPMPMHMWDKIGETQKEYFRMNHKKEKKQKRKQYGRQGNNKKGTKHTPEQEEIHQRRREDAVKLLEAEKSLRAGRNEIAEVTKKYILASLSQEERVHIHAFTKALERESLRMEQKLKNCKQNSQVLEAHREVYLKLKEEILEIMSESNEYSRHTVNGLLHEHPSSQNRAALIRPVPYMVNPKPPHPDNPHYQPTLGLGSMGSETVYNVPRRVPAGGHQQPRNSTYHGPPTSRAYGKPRMSGECPTFAQCEHPQPFTQNNIEYVHPYIQHNHLVHGHPYPQPHPVVYRHTHNQPHQLVYRHTHNQPYHLVQVHPHGQPHPVVPVYPHSQPHPLAHVHPNRQPHPVVPVHPRSQPHPVAPAHPDIQPDPSAYVYRKIPEIASKLVEAENALRNDRNKINLHIRAPILVEMNKRMNEEIREISEIIRDQYDGVTPKMLKCEYNGEIIDMYKETYTKLQENVRQFLTNSNYSKREYVNKILSGHIPERPYKKDDVEPALDDPPPHPLMDGHTIHASEIQSNTQHLQENGRSLHPRKLNPSGRREARA